MGSQTEPEKEVKSFSAFLLNQTIKIKKTSLHPWEGDLIMNIAFSSFFSELCLVIPFTEYVYVYTGVCF